MKQIGVCLLIAGLIGICSAGSALAQLTADVTAAIPMPTGDFADAADPGFGVGADLFVGLPLLPIKLGGHVGYNQFKEKDDNGAGDTTMIEIIPSVRYQIGLPLDVLSFWGQFGLGMYRWENDLADDTDFGLSAGVGIAGMIAPGIRVMAMPMYHIVMAEDDNLSYISANVGLQF